MTGHDHGDPDDGFQRDGGTDPPGATSDESIDLEVPDMDCPSCAGKVTSALEGTDGVTDVDARPATGTVVVGYDDASADSSDISRAVESAGYEVTGTSDDAADEPTDVEDTRGPWTSPRAIKTWVGATLLAFGLAFEFGLIGGFEGPIATVLSVEFSLADVLFLGAVGVAGQEILRGGYYSVRTFSLDIDFLMSIAIVSAVTASILSPDARLYSEAATLSVLFSVAELLERYSMDQARSSLRELMDLSPDEATVRRDGEELTVPVEELVVGDTVLVQPGEKIPVDGAVTEGSSAVNEAPITGESVPVDKVDGDEVYAGTVNQAGYLEIEVTAAAGEDTLSRIVEMVEDAQSNRTEHEQFVDRFAGYYTPLMVTLAVLVAIIPPLLLGAPWITWFVNGITMLVLACPCAFVISTPVTVVSGITSAAKHGVLIKGGRYLESMGQVEAIAMDKTGTLTKGELAVTDVIPVDGRDEDDVLACARGLEQRSEHPIGEAIVAHASDNGVATAEVSEFESLTGKGVQATLGGEAHYAGKPGLFESLGFDLEHVHVVESDADVDDELRDMCDRQGCLNLAEDTIPRLQNEGKTVVLVGRAGQSPAASRTESGETEYELEGIIAVADELRPEAAWTVDRLQSLGVDVVMLTGDNERTARAIGERVGVDDVRAELLPDEKVAAIEALDAEYDGGVAMVGDGINDAPALATATVGVAMGAAGTDTALETADVALMSDDISKLPYLYDLAHRANGVIRQNIWASLGMKALLAVGVPLGFVNLAIAVLLGDAGMTVGVTGNAMRLSRVQPDEFDGE